MGSVELAVVGAGPAGMSAAIAAARSGLHTALLDEYPRPGGQYLTHRSPSGKGASKPDASPSISAAERQGRALLHQLAETDLEMRTQTLVWGIERAGEGWRLALHGPRGLDWLEAQAVIVAAGARELVIPFPGWTLPGVMTLGAAQILAKEHGVLPGRRALLAGSGPLLLAAADELTRRGAQVAAVLEAVPLSRWLRHAPAIWGNWDRLSEGRHYLAGLWRSGTPYRPGWTVVQALGGDELEAVVVARLDRRGRPTSGSQQQVPADSLCLGFGFVPNVELTQLAGCAHVFDPARGGWVPSVDERQETSLPGLYVAGEAAGVAGAAAAMLEGHIAGMAAAHRLGRLPESQLARELAARAARRRRLGRFAAMLNTLFAPAPGLDALTTDATPICRCEEVSAGQVRAAIRRGAAELDALKTWTRVGQGACQGRTCGPLLARLVARETGRPLGQAGCFGVRPPLKPIPLGDLAQEGAP